MIMADCNDSETDERYKGMNLEDMLLLQSVADGIQGSIAGNALPCVLVEMKFYGLSMILPRKSGGAGSENEG